MPNGHSLLGGKVQVYRRANSSQWQCSAWLAGKNHRASTRTDSLERAKAFAEDWYLGLRGKLASGTLTAEKTFRDAAAAFVEEYEVITDGERSPAYVRGHRDRIRLHLNPHFGDMPLAQITASAVQAYRVQRMKLPPGQPGRRRDMCKNVKDRVATRPARATLHHELVTLRQVLKTALRHGWIQHLPDMTAPYRSAGKVSHRAWFSPQEYATLCDAIAVKAQDRKNHKRAAWAQLHDYVLFIANTGLRPDEAALLEFRDVQVVDDQASGERILVISARGKRGTGYCKSTRDAVAPFERLLARRAQKAKTEAARSRSVGPGDAPKPTDRLFPARQTKVLTTVLMETRLKEDREGRPRTAYSLRHTYICTRLMEGADIYQVAKNCRTSVEMIEKFYAAHLKTTIDASALNVRRADAGAAQRAA